VTRVEVDRALCMGSGVCELEAPEVFELDADGVLQVHEVTDVAAGGTALGTAVETAVRACPTGALQLID
jgi:ferredoxin